MVNSASFKILFFIILFPFFTNGTVATISSFQNKSFLEKTALRTYCRLGSLFGNENTKCFNKNTDVDIQNGQIPLSESDIQAIVTKKVSELFAQLNGAVTSSGELFGNSATRIIERTVVERPTTINRYITQPVETKIINNTITQPSIVTAVQSSQATGAFSNIPVPFWNGGGSSGSGSGGSVGPVGPAGPAGPAGAPGTTTTIIIGGFATTTGDITATGTITAFNFYTTNASTTNSTTTNSFTQNANTINSTTTNAFITNAAIGNSTTTNSFNTNLISTNATTTNLFSTIANIVNLAFTNAIGTNLTITGNTNLGSTTFSVLPTLPLTLGNILVGNALNVATPLAPGINGQVFTIVGGIPQWTATSTLGVGSINSVFGRTGTVVAVNGDYNSDQITEGATNLYFTNARARNALSAINGITYNNVTGVIGEAFTGSTGVARTGNNFSLTNTGVAAGTYGSSTTVPVVTVDAQGRVTSVSTTTVAGGGAVTSVFSRTGAVVANSGDYNSDQVTEGGTNLYFTNNRVRGTLLTGLATTTGSILATDSVLQAFGKIQGNFDILSASSSGISSLNGQTGIIQTFATGTTGSDFNIVSGSNTHTFNLPSSSILSRGLLTALDFATFLNKLATATGTAGQIVRTGDAQNPVFSLANTGVTAGTYGSSTTVPIITVDTQGRLTSVATTATPFLTAANFGSTTINNFVANNSSTTNSTSTNAFVNNFNSTNSTSTNTFVTNFTAANATTTNLFSTLANFTSLLFGTATGTNLFLNNNLTVNGTTTLGTTIFSALPSIPLALGNLLVGNASNVAAPVAPGAAGTILSIVSGVPTWVATSTLVSPTTNTLSTTGNVLTTNVNGVLATTTAITSNLFTSVVNTLTSTVNGIASAASNIINSFTQSLSGNVLTTTINGVTATSSVIGNNTLSTSGTDIVSNVNGVVSTTSLTSAITGATTNNINFATSTNTLTSTVNGVTSTTSIVANAPVTSVFSRIGTVVANSGDYNTLQVTENTNLYFTEPRVRNTVLTGFATTSGSVVATDSILQAFGKLQNSVNIISASSSGIADINGQTGLSQAIVAGTTGSDFNIVSASNIHTLNLPSASILNRGALTVADFITFNNKVGTARNIFTGTGLTGGGDLSADLTLSLTNTGVTANTYGSATQVGTFTVDAQGRLTTAGNTTITPLASSITGAGTLSGGSSKVSISGGIGATLLNASVDVIEGNLTLNNIGGILGFTKGGTGLSTLGSANQLLRVNGAGTLLEYFTPSFLTSEVDGVIGNEVTDVTVTNGLTRTGTVAAGYNLAINSPTCTGTQKLSWNGTAFVCGTDVDTDTDTTNFNIRANAGATQNIASGTIVSFLDGTGTQATRAGSDIAYNLTNTGVTAGTYTSVNVDAQGRVTSGTNPGFLTTEVDGVIGNEVFDIATTTGITRTGTKAGGYTLGVNLGDFTTDSLTEGATNLYFTNARARNALSATNGITYNSTTGVIGDALTASNGVQRVVNNFAINAPTCTGLNKLQWNGSAFTCIADVDTTNFNIRANAGSLQNITAGDTVRFLDSTGIVAARTVNDISFTLANTAVTANTYGSATQFPTFTVDAQGRLTNAGTQTLNTTNVAEGTNLYFTEARVRATPLTGFALTAGTITASDSVLSAFGKTQQQIDGLTGSSHAAVTLGTANGLSLLGQQISLGLAGAGTTGALSSTDWNTFNNKVASTRSVFTSTGLTGGGDLSADRTLALTNTGVAAATYGSSTTIPVLTVDAQGRLTVASSTSTPFLTAATLGSTAFIQNGNSFGTTAVLGTNDNQDLTFETNATTTGRISADGRSIAFGIGSQALANNMNVMGENAGRAATGADESSFIGLNAGNGAVGAFYSNFLGSRAGSGATSAINANFFGQDAGINAIGAQYSNFLGNQAGVNAANASNSNFFGQSAGAGAAGSGQANFFGQSAGSGATNAQASNFFGPFAGFNAVNAFNSNFFGSSAGDGATSANNANFFGRDAGDGATAAGGSNFFGQRAGQNASNAILANFIGEEAGQNAANAQFSNFIGRTAGKNATGAIESNFIGVASGINAATAARSIFFGNAAGQSDTVNNTTNTTDSSILIGNNTNTGGFSNSIAIGAYTLNTAARQLNLGNSIFATDIHVGPTQSGTPVATSFVGIGTSTPSEKLQVEGGIRFSGALMPNNLAGATGTLLMSQGVGIAPVWTSTSTLVSSSTIASSFGFIQNGNSFGTNAILGTNDAFDLTFETNGTTTGRISADGLRISFGLGAQALTNDMFVAGQGAGQGATNSFYSNFLGSSAGESATNAYESNFMGRSAGFNAINADSSNFFGANAGQDATNAYESNFMGRSAGNNATFARNSNFIGHESGQGSVNGFQSSFIGQRAGFNAINANNSNFIGRSSGLNATGANNSNFVGSLAGEGATSAFQSNFLGSGAGFNAINANNSNFIGRSSGLSAINANNSNFVGSLAGNGATGASNSNFLGSNAGLNAVNAQLSNFLGNNAGQGATSAFQSNFLGSTAGNNAINANNSNFVGDSAGNGATNAAYATFLGYSSGQNATNANDSNFMGGSAGQGATNASRSVFIGQNSGSGDVVNNTIGANDSSILIGNHTNTGGFSNSIAIGAYTLNTAARQLNLGNSIFATNIHVGPTQSGAPIVGSFVGIGIVAPAFKLDVAGDAQINGVRVGLGSGNVTGNVMVGTSGSVNTGLGQAFFGKNAGLSNTAGNFNSFFGADAGISNAGGSSNAAFGASVLQSVTSGSDNVAIGVLAGAGLISGSSNTFLGRGAGTSNAAITNATAVGANVSLTDDNTVILGNGANVGIGTTAPATKLQVFGDIRVGTTGSNGCIENFAGTALVGTCSSDENLKTEIVDLNTKDIAEKFSKLRFVSYKWNDTASTLYKRATDQTVYGILAQDVALQFPELVHTDNKNYKTVDTTTLTWYGLASLKQSLGEFSDSLFGKLRTWFADVSNGITKVFAKEVETEKLCLSENGEKFCITKEDLQQLKDLIGSQSENGRSGSGGTSGDGGGGTGGGTSGTGTSTPTTGSSTPATDPNAPPAESGDPNTPTADKNSGESDEPEAPTAPAGDPQQVTGENTDPSTPII